MPEWHGELRLAFIDSDRVTFHKHPEDDLPLTPGRRYAAVFVEIADDETLAPEGADRRAVKHVKRNPSNVAAILAKTPLFQRWCSMQMQVDGSGKLPANEDTAVEFIRRRCVISSRAQLDMDPSALERFHSLVELPYYTYEREHDDRA